MSTEQRKLLNLLLDGKQGHFTAESVLSSTGVTAEAHMANADIHTHKVVIDSERAAAIDTAIAALKTGDIKTLSDALNLLKGTVETFMDNEPDGGTIDRLSELIAEIKANKDNISAIVADNLKLSDLVNDLTTGGTDKALTAEQGKALKVLLDALSSAQHGHTNKEVLDSVGKAGNGNLTFNGKELSGETGIAFMGSVGDIPAYTGKIQFVVSTVDVAV